MSTSSQCIVPGDEWDVDNHNPAQTTVLSRRTHSISANSLPVDVPSLDYEVAELTWENGQLAMHGLAGPRVGTTKLTAWDKPLAGDTLESLVNQATSCHIPPAVAAEQLNDLWADHHRNIAIDNAAAAAAAAVTMDRLVPCNTVAAANNNNSNTRSKNAENKENPGLVLGQAPAGTGTGTGTCGGGCSTKVGSCSGGASVAARGGRAPRRGPWQCGTRSESATFGTGTESLQMTLTDDSTYSAKGFFGGGFSTSTSLWSPENTSSGGDTKTSADDYTKISADDHDSVCITQKASGDRKRKASGKSSVSPRARAAANHNQSERKRRDRINQRMKILQKMVPNSSKTDKASMLDEVINYFKHLQAQVNVQVHVMRMNVQVHMMRLAMQQQQQLQMSMMAAPTMGVGMGIMDPMGRAAAAGVPSIVPPPGGYVPVPPWNVQSVDRSRSPDLLSAYLACQPQQPMTIDAYSRLAALYHQQLQHQQPHAPGPKNN